MVEVLFTGLASVLGGDRAAAAQTSLWMHPIYGGTALALEEVQRRMRRAPRATRALASVGVIYAAEYGSGWLLRKLLGKCPWDYGGHGLEVHGLIRLDYAPAWFGLALLFEPLHEVITTVAKKRPEGAPVTTPSGKRADAVWPPPAGVLAADTSDSAPPLA